MAKAPAQKPVLVTTQFRGVFFGYVKADKKLPAEITLNGARNCIHWSADVKGFMGLAATGPNKNCRIGARVAEITLYGVTGIVEVEDAAVKAWEAA